MTDSGSDAQVRKVLARARTATRLTFLVAGIAMAAWAPMVPYAKARLGLDEATLGLVLLALGAGSAVSMPLVGLLAHHWGYRRVIVGASLLASLALPLLTWVPGVAGLTATLFGYGFLLGTMDVAMNSHAVEVERRDGRALMSGFHGLFSVGGLVGSGGLSALLSFGLPLPAAATVIAVVLAVVVMSQRTNLLPAQASTDSSLSARLHLPDRLLMLLGLLCFVSFLAEGALLDWSAVFLRDVRAVAPSLAGLGYSSFSVAMAVGRLAGDAAIMRLGAVLAVRVGAAVAAAGLLLAALVPTVSASLIGFALVGLGAANIVPVMFSAAGRLPGRVPSMSLATVTALGYAGMLTGPALIGFVAHASSLSLALSLVAALLLCVSAAARIVRPNEGEVR
ncbi:MFS transporter [uncultured Paludibaculum sp.]|uniref:MFS transporter n=1 Tax=uncultured Paludibaculum sp. TaxID=1765020 RepID=UPI00374CBCA5